MHYNVNKKREVEKRRVLSRKNTEKTAEKIEITVKVRVKVKIGDNEER